MSAAPTAPTTSPTGRRALVFHPLRVAAVDHETPDSVVVTFDVPPELADIFRFVPGQHLTIRHRAGEGDPSEVRRSYSLCTMPGGPLRIGVRRVEGGRVSTWFTEQLAIGDEVEVLPPLGTFVLAAPTGVRRRLTFVAAGSGITPVLAMVAAVLEDDPDAEVGLLVINRSLADAMFVEDLSALKSRHLGRLQLTFCCTREQREGDPLGHRPTRTDLRRLHEAGVLSDADEWYLCGPSGLLDELGCVLDDACVNPERVHRELFITDRHPVLPVTQHRTSDAGTPVVQTVTVTFLGRSTTVAVQPGATLLDAARGVRSDLPYSCEAGVCSTCRALVRSGAVDSPECAGLTRKERSDGFVLTCQATAASGQLALDFDV